MAVARVPLQQAKLNQVIKACGKRWSACICRSKQGGLPTRCSIVQKRQNFQRPGLGCEVDKLRDIHKV